MKSVIFLACILFFSINISAQQINQKRLTELSKKHTIKSFPILKDLLSIPNDAFYPENIEKNILWCENEFQKRNFTTLRLETETVPLLFPSEKQKMQKRQYSYIFK